MKCALCGCLLENHHQDSAFTYGFCWHCPCEGGRDVFPALKSVVTEAAGGCAVDAMKSMRDRAHAEGDEQTARFYDKILAEVAIPESDLIQ